MGRREKKREARGRRKGNEGEKEREGGRKEREIRGKEEERTCTLARVGNKVTKKYRLLNLLCNFPH